MSNERPLREKVARMRRSNKDFLVLTSDELGEWNEQEREMMGNFYKWVMLVGAPFIAAAFFGTGKTEGLIIGVGFILLMILYFVLEQRDREKVTSDIS